MATTHFKQFNYLGGRIRGTRVQFYIDLRKNFQFVDRPVEEKNTILTSPTGIVHVDSLGPATRVINPASNSIQLPLNDGQTFWRGSLFDNATFIWRQRLPSFGVHRWGKSSLTGFVAGYVPLGDRTLRMYSGSTSHVFAVSNPYTDAEWSQWRTFVYTLSKDKSFAALYCDGEELGGKSWFAYATNLADPYYLGRAYGSNYSSVNVDYQYFGLCTDALSPSIAKDISRGDNILMTLEPEYFRWWPIGAGGGAPGQSGSVTDSVSLSDVITGLAHKIGQIADSATLTDTITGTVTAGESGSVADQASLTDVIDVLMGHIGITGSTAATADTIQGVAHYLVDLADNAILSDTIEGSTALSDSIDDAATLSDLISALQGYVGSISESVTVSDVIDGNLGNQIAYINESVVMSSSVTGIASYIGNVYDHAGMADLIMVMSDDTGEETLDRVIEDVVVDSINDTGDRVEIMKDGIEYRRGG